VWVEVTGQFSDLIGWTMRYLLTLRITDVLDIVIMAFVAYQLLNLVQSTRVANLVKGVLIFIVGLGLVNVLNLNGISFILSYIMDLGVLALIILFQPELRRILEEVGSRKLNVLGFFSHARNVSVMEQTVSK
jgi:diadenylate cyclase